MIEYSSTLGEKLLGAAMVYTVVALILSISYIAAGGSPPPFLPGYAGDLVRETYQAWLQIRGAEFSATNIATVVAALNLVTRSFMLVLGVTVAAVSSYVWLAYLASSLLPYPLSILSIPLWIGATFATIVMVLYLLQKVYDVLSSLRPIPLP